MDLPCMQTGAWDPTCASSPCWSVAVPRASFPSAVCWSSTETLTWASLSGFQGHPWIEAVIWSLLREA